MCIRDRLTAIPGLMKAFITVELSPLFVCSRVMMVRERASATFRVVAAYSARLCSVLPLRLISITVFGTVLYYLAGLRTDSFVYFLIYVGFVWLTLLIDIALGALLSAFGASLQMVVLYQIYLGIFFFVLSGIPVNVSDMTPILSWLRFLSPFFYISQGLAQNECSGLMFGTVSGDEYLEAAGLSELSVMWCAGALMITFVGYLIIGYVGLYYSTKPRFKVL